jgi:hypothetical protein
LQRPRRDQQLRAAGQPAGQRGDGEHGQAGQEHLLAADQVAEPSGQQQQAAECDQIGVQHPGDVGGGQAEIPLDDGQGHGHDGAIEDDHECGGAEGGERKAARSPGGRGGGACHHGSFPDPAGPQVEP